jgi:hypothetical protein
VAERAPNPWKTLEAQAKAADWKERSTTYDAVEEWDGWHFKGTDSAGRWIAVGPGGKRIVASSSAELVRKVRAENDEDDSPARPVQGVLL